MDYSALRLRRWRLCRQRWARHDNETDRIQVLAACGESRSSSPLVIGEGIDRIDPAP